MSDVVVPQWVVDGHLPHSVQMAVLQFEEAVKGLQLTSMPEWANGPQGTVLFAGVLYEGREMTLAVEVEGKLQRTVH